MDLLNFLTNKITNEDTLAFQITDILQMRAEETPDKIAFIYLKDGEDEEERITYLELYQSATSIAQELIAYKKERAIMLYPPGLEFIKALFACFYAGVIAVPAYPPRKNRSLNRIKSIVLDSEASLVLTTEQIFQASKKNFADVEELKDLNWIVSDKIKIETQVVNSFSISIDDIALLQYTSGSTGMPKGVMVTHKNIMRNSEYIRQSFEFSFESVGVSWLPSFHDMGLVGQIFQQVYTGYPCIFMSPVAFLQKPIRWLKAITKYKGTMGGAPNFAYDMLVENTTEEEREGLDLSSLKTLYCGAEPIRRETFEDFVEVYQSYGFKEEMLYPCFGMAETTLITTGPKALDKPTYLAISASMLEKNKIEINPKEASDIKYVVGVGRPWLDTDVRIVDPQTKKHCQKNEVGEIWISGTSTAIGYWNKPELNEKDFNAFTADTKEGPFFRSGDLGFVYNNEFFISGRLKDLLIIRGRNYYPQDIEFVAEQCHPSLRSNASAAFPIEVEGEEKIAIALEVERSALRNLDVEEISSKVRTAIFEEFDVEVYAVILIRTVSIPKTSSGKIQRKATKKGYLEKTLNIVGESVMDLSEEEKSEASLTSVQSWLIAWLSINLKIGIEKINPQRPIVAYGLNSIKAVVLRNDFLKAYGVDFPPYLFFEKMSIEDTAKKALELIEEKES